MERKGDLGGVWGVFWSLLGSVSGWGEKGVCCVGLGVNVGQMWGILVPGSGGFWGEAGKAVGSHCGPTAAAGTAATRAGAQNSPV